MLFYILTITGNFSSKFIKMFNIILFLFTNEEEGSQDQSVPETFPFSSCDTLTILVS